MAVRAIKQTLWPGLDWLWLGKLDQSCSRKRRSPDSDSDREKNVVFVASIFKSALMTVASDSDSDSDSDITLFQSGILTILHTCYCHHNSQDE